MRLVVLWNVDFDPCHSREKLADWVPMSTFEKRDAAFTRAESFSIGEFNSAGRLLRLYGLLFAWWRPSALVWRLVFLDFAILNMAVLRQDDVPRQVRI